MLGIAHVSWVRLQTYKATYTYKHLDPERLSVGQTNICSMRVSNPQHAVQQPTTALS